MAAVCCQVSHTPGRGGGDVPWNMKLAKGSTILMLKALCFGDTSVYSHLTQATKKRRSSKDKALVLQVGCREATGVREMQDTEQRGWLTLHHRSPRLACCKPGGRAVSFLASWVLMEVVGEDRKMENRLQFWGGGKLESWKGAGDTREGTTQEHLLQTPLSY